MSSLDGTTLHKNIRKKQQIVEELNIKLQLQQNVFTKATPKNLEASFIVAGESHPRD